MRITLANVQQINLSAIGTIYLKSGVALGAHPFIGFEIQHRGKIKFIGQTQAFYRV